MEILNKDERKRSGLPPNLGNQGGSGKFRYNQRKTGVNDLFSKKVRESQGVFNFCTIFFNVLKCFLTKIFFFQGTNLR